MLDELLGAPPSLAPPLPAPTTAKPGWHPKRHPRRAFPPRSSLSRRVSQDRSHEEVSPSPLRPPEQSRGQRLWPTGRLPSSPRCGRGKPMRFECKADCGKGPLVRSFQKTIRDPLREGQVAVPRLDPQQARMRRKGTESRTRYPLEEGSEIQSFWGQLWQIPKSKSRNQQPSVREARQVNLVWVRRELWDSRSLAPEDCYPISEGDVWVDLLKKLRFAEVLWEDEKKRSFAEILKYGMANRARGRGQQPRSPDGEWGDWGGGGWNQFPPNPYTPPFAPANQFHNQPPPPPFGFFPNQLQQHPQPPTYGQFRGPARPRGGGVGGRGRQQPVRQQGQGPEQGQNPTTNL